MLLCGRMAPPLPHGYVKPPPPSWADGLRTLRTLGTDLAPAMARLALHRWRPLASTTSAVGLASTRATFGRALRRFGVELEVLRAEVVPREGGLVLLWNQESHLDHLVLATAIPRPFFSLYNNAVARFPFYGEHMRTTGHVRVDRNDEAQWRPAVAEAARRVREGECVLVSPEGTRSWDTRLLPMKRGAMLLACEAARPIVCVTVIGGHARLPRGASVVRRGPMRVVFSDPMDPVGEPERLGAVIAETFDRLKLAHALEENSS